MLAASQVFRDFLNDSSESGTFVFNQEQSQKRLDRSLPINANYNEIFIVGTNGTVRISTDPTQVGQDKTADDYFIEGKKGTFIKSIYLSPITHKISYALSSPIFDDTTKDLLGVLVIRVNIEDIVPLLTDLSGLGKTGEHFLIDNNLNLITPSKYLDITNVLNKKIETQNARDCIANKHIDSAGVQNYKDYRGVPIVGTHKYIPDAHWCLITKIDQSEIYQPVSFAASIILVLIVTGIFIFIIIGIFVSRNISRPIENLVTGIMGISKQGNLDQKVGTNSKDEIGVLSRAFDQMTSSLKQSRLDIERQVVEQTQEIIAKGKDLEDQQKAILNILEDVDAEKDKSLLEKNKFEALLISIGDGIIATDADTKIIVMNPAAERLLKWKQEEVVGKKLVDIIPVVDDKGNPIANAERPIMKAVSELKPFTTSTNSNIYYVTHDNIRIPVLLNAAPVIVGGALIGAVNVFRDISHEKDVDRMKTEFISLASHQLRTPLSAMKWFSEMLLAGDAGVLTAEQKEYIGNISQSNERMIALVNSLLNISRIESGRIMIDPEPTDMNTLLTYIVKELQMKLDEKKITLIASVHPDLPKVMLDPKLIGEVCKNLLTNSIKYTPQGGEITVFVSKKEEEIVMQVTDTGYGILEKDKDKVFSKFYRGENIIKLETDGTGLGLYLVKAIIDSSGGKIWFESTEGKGTTFWFSLPMTGMKKKEGEVTINA